MEPRSHRRATAITRAAATLLAEAKAHNHRLALVLTGEADWTLWAVEAALSALPAGRRVWLSDRKSGVGILPVAQGSKLLGSEAEILIYDAHSGLDPNSLGSALGALRGGGLFLVLAPALDLWPEVTDPSAARVAVHPFTADQVSGRFIARFARALVSSPGLLVVSESGHVPTPQPLPPFIAAASGQPDSDCLTPDQAQAVEAVLKTARGRARRPLVLISDRGRGKSSAMGIAAARLLEQGRHNILATAPRRSAVSALFHRIGQLQPGAEVDGSSVASSGASLRFLPPDELARSRHHADLLLVDEAAGIPAPLLEHLLLTYPRVVFATTVHGYEGAGRGFEVRFRHTLERITPLWREMRMQTPIRWAPDDPLERFAARALLLDATPAPAPLISEASPSNCSFRRLDRGALADDEPTLTQLFGLLVLAHYQTQPADLRHLLDGPNVRVYALLHRRQVAATALVAVEGPFDAELSRDIFAGRRRPRGHLLPQTLCAHAGIEQAARLGFARVVRIAVHPAAQGKGLGKSLLTGIADDTLALGLDLIGSSFGATSALLRFWERCGFLAVHMGTARNAASGTHGAVVLRPLSAAGRYLLVTATERLSLRLPALLSEPLRDLEPDIAAHLLQSAPRSEPPLPPPERTEVEHFAFALRSYESTFPPLLDLARGRIGKHLREGYLEDRERDLLIYKLLQGRDWVESCRLLGLTGRAQALSLLRLAVGRLLHGCERQSKK